MTIHEEVAGLIDLMAQLEEATANAPDGQTAEVEKLHRAIDDRIAKHKISKDVQLQFQAVVARDVSDYRVRKVGIWQFLFRPDPASCPTEWFSRWESLGDGMLDGSVFYDVYDPALFRFAENM